MGEIIALHPGPKDRQTSRMRSLTTVRPQVAIRTVNGIRILAWSEIIYCESDSNYTQIHLENGEHILVSKTLSDVEAVLPESHFVRIHQSWLVNRRAISFLSKTGVEVINGARLPVSRARRQEVLDFLSKNWIIL